jgi:hypothetical protein
MAQPGDLERYVKNRKWVQAWVQYSFFVRPDSETRGDYAKSWRAAKELWSLSRERAAAIAGIAAHDTYD